MHKTVFSMWETLGYEGGLSIEELEIYMGVRHVNRFQSNVTLDTEHSVSAASD